MELFKAAVPHVDIPVAGVAVNDAGNLEVTTPLAGSAAASTPLAEAVCAPLDVSAGGTFTLTAAQYACPMIFLTGTLGGAVTLVFPNTVGGVWDVSIADCTLSSHAITCETALPSVTAVIASTATSGARVGVYGLQKMACFGVK